MGKRQRGEYEHAKQKGRLATVEQLARIPPIDCPAFSRTRDYSSRVMPLSMTSCILQQAETILVLSWSKTSTCGEKGGGGRGLRERERGRDRATQTCTHELPHLP